MSNYTPYKQLAWIKLYGDSFGTLGGHRYSVFGGKDGYHQVLHFPGFYYGRTSMRDGRTQVGKDGSKGGQPPWVDFEFETGGSIYAGYPPINTNPYTGSGDNRITVYSQPISTGARLTQCLDTGGGFQCGNNYEMDWKLYFWYNGGRYINFDENRDFKFGLSIVGIDTQLIPYNNGDYCMFTTAASAFNPLSGYHGTAGGANAGFIYNGGQAGNGGDTLHPNLLRVHSSVYRKGIYNGADPSDYGAYETDHEFWRKDSNGNWEWAEPIRGVAFATAIDHIDIQFKPVQVPTGGTGGSSSTQNPKPTLGPPPPGGWFPPAGTVYPTNTPVPPTNNPISRPPGPGGPPPGGGGLNAPTTTLPNPVTPTIPPGGTQQGVPNSPPPGNPGPGIPPIPQGGGGGGGNPGPCTIVGGVITNIAVSHSGYGYVQPPHVIITGGGGTGAAATATVSNGQITGFVITNGGSGYTDCPKINIVPRTPPNGPVVSPPPPTMNPTPPGTGPHTGGACVWPLVTVIDVWGRPHCVTRACCFIGNTPVTMADGTYKRIEDIQVGDKVKTHKGTNVAENIQKVLLGDRLLYDINNTGEYFATECHLFKTTSGWRSINPDMTLDRYPHMKDIIEGKLSVGDKLETENGIVDVISLDRSPVNDPETIVYDITIKDDRTLYANGLLAHNHWVPAWPQSPVDPTPPTPGSFGCIGPHLGAGPGVFSRTVSGDSTRLSECSCLPTGSPLTMAKIYQATIDGGIPAHVTDCGSSGHQPWQGQYIKLEVRNLPSWYEGKFYSNGLNAVTFAAMNTGARLVGMSEVAGCYSSGSNSIKTTSVVPPGTNITGDASPSQSTWDKVVKYPIYIKEYNSLRIFAKNPFDEQGTRYVGGKDPVGYLYWNPYHNMVTSATFVDYSLSGSFGRTLTAANYDATDFSMFYAPTNGFRGLQPLTLSGTDPDYVFQSLPLMFHQRGSGYGTTYICYQVEGFTYNEYLSGYGTRQFPIPAPGLNPQPTFLQTSNTVQLTGNYPYGNRNSGWSCLGRDFLTRPRRVLPVNNAIPGHSYHEDYVRRFNVWNGQSNDHAWREEGFKFSLNINPLSAKVYSVTHGSYPNTTASHIVSARLRSEMNFSTDWRVAEFTDFVNISSYSTELMSQFMISNNMLASNAPLTAQNPTISLLGYCTYNGSLTADSGDFYVMGCVFHNKPVALETAGEVSNFVVCTSGTDLFLPYIVSRTLSSSEL